MNDTLVGILGLAVIAAIVISLTRGKMLPAMAFILWPSVLALAMVVAGRCSFADIEAMIKAGFDSTAPTAALFVFSVLFFGIMTDAGMFDVLIKKLMTLMGITWSALPWSPPSWRWLAIWTEAVRPPSAS
jgi:CitMHS family citrate-Mg2+:H+ or citrate-Ca2+:H+ symporter